MRTFAEYGAVEVGQQDPWPECGHQWRPFHSMREYHDFMDVHRAGRCDRRCHWCADEVAERRAYTTRGIDAPRQLVMGL